MTVRRESLYLPAEGLLSKWGFNDGDEPDDFLDWCEEQGIPYDGLDWKLMLRRLVREYLIPALDQRVEVVEVDTAHNPIRAASVDGEDVTGCWVGADDDPELTPYGVEVSYEVVARVAGLLTP